MVCKSSSLKSIVFIQYWKHLFFELRWDWIRYFLGKGAIQNVWLEILVFEDQIINVIDCKVTSSFDEQINWVFSLQLCQYLNLRICCSRKATKRFLRGDKNDYVLALFNCRFEEFFEQFLFSISLDDLVNIIKTNQKSQRSLAVLYFFVLQFVFLWLLIEKIGNYFLEFSTFWFLYPLNWLAVCHIQVLDHDALKLVL